MLLSKAARYTAFSQLSLYGFLAICTLLMPHFLFERNEGGASNYGVHTLTVGPYTLAFGLASWFLIIAAKKLKTANAVQRQLRRLLYILSGLLLCVLLSTYPYKVNRTFNNIHILAGITLLVAELGIGLWLALVVCENRTNYALFALQAGGFMLAAMTLLDLAHVLFIAQLLSGLAFGVLLVRGVTALSSGAAKSKA